MKREMYGLSFLNDIVFKMIFGKQANEALLRALINALLELDSRDRITSLQIVNPHLDREYPDHKEPVLDVRARDARGNRPALHRHHDGMSR